MESQLGHISKDAVGQKISQLPHQSKVLMISMVLTAGRPGSGADILSELQNFVSLSIKLCINLLEYYLIDFWKSIFDVHSELFRLGNF